MALWLGTLPIIANRFKGDTIFQRCHGIKASSLDWCGAS
jgi:hypothetical protein